MLSRTVVAEVRNILWVMRDALTSSNTVTPTEQGTARIILLRDEKVAELVSRMAHNINALSEELARLEPSHGEESGQAEDR